MLLLGAFGPTDEWTAIFYIAAVVCFGLAVLGGAAARRVPGGAMALIALGLGLWLFPTMWNTAEAAF